MPRADPKVAGRFVSREELKKWVDRNRRKTRFWNDAAWQQRNRLTAVDLTRLGLLSDEAAMRASLRYPAAVTPYYLSLADWQDQNDPIRRQWLPEGRELMRLFSDAQEDPFDEARSSPIPGLVHRFRDRILLMVSKVCAVRCRHCTRKNVLDDAQILTPTVAAMGAVQGYLEAHPEIHEVILSGGDPLLLTDARLLRWVQTLSRLPQLDAIRIGTRVPCVMPMRVTAKLAAALGHSGRVWVNTQFNHINEITAESAAACARLVEAGIPVSNQSVLLKGVNDSVADMVALCRGLQRMRVRPYYVFVCDPVTGTLHFRTSIKKAREISRELTTRVGGLLLPRFVVDEPHALSKTSVELEREP